MNTTSTEHVEATPLSTEHPGTIPPSMDFAIQDSPLMRWTRSGWLTFAPPPFEDPSKLIYSPSHREKLANFATQFRNGREAYEALQLPWRRGILFAGPAGQGKTAATRAIAHFLGPNAPHWTIPAHEILNASTWEYALSDCLDLSDHWPAPRVIILDDIDTVIGKMEPFEFFSILDHALARSEGSIWIATTRHADLLPKTQAIRPGRFEQVLRFDGPNIELREQLLRNLPLGIPDENSFRDLLELTEGLTFAHFEELRQICATLLLENREYEMVSTVRVFLQDQLITGDRNGKPSDLTLETRQRIDQVDARVLKAALELTDVLTGLMDKTLAEAFERSRETGESNAEE